MILRARKRLVAILTTAALVTASLVAAIGAAPAGAVTPGAPYQLVISGIPASTVAGVVMATNPTVTVEDFNGNTVTTDNVSQITLSIPPPNNPGGTLTCTNNTVTASAGVATFLGCKIDKATFPFFHYQLTAEDSSYGLANISGSFDITPGTATQAVFVDPPADSTVSTAIEGAGGNPNPVVAVEDQFGNVATGDVGHSLSMVVIGVNPGPGTLSGCSLGGESSGTFQISGCQIDTAGTGYTLVATVTPALSTSSTAQSTPFNISDGTATQLVFVHQPVGGLPGQPFFAPELAFEDASGRVVTTDPNTATLALVQPVPPLPVPGNLSICTGASNNSNGILYWGPPGCQIDQPGVGYALKATSGALTATSNLFTVGNFHLAFFIQPGNGVANTPLSTQPQIALEDVNNQLVPGLNFSVGLHIKPGTGTPGATLMCHDLGFGVNVSVLANGLADYTQCTIDKPGIGYQLTADYLPAGLSVDSAAFNVIGPATQLVFTTEPSNGTTNSPLSTQPVVSVEDAAGNVITSDNTNTVTLSITSGTPTTGGPGTLCCTTNPVTVTNGVATFAGCTIDTAGTGYKLTATDTVPLTPAVSTTFNITAGTPLPTRIFGADAIATAIAVSQAEFPKTGSASAVVLARSDFFSDGLAGGPLAAAVGGPLLITPGTPLSASLDARVQTEIQRILPTGKTVYILGGPLAVSSNVDATLTGLGYNVVRVQGANEFATAVAIANQLGNPSTVFEATGLFFADALSAVPAVIHTGGAILLTNGTTQAAETLVYLAAHPADTRYAIGGPQAAYGADPGATPVYGQDEYGTSAAVASTFLPKAKIYGVATGLNYPDALAGGVFMATGGRLGPVLLVTTDLPLPVPISGYLATLAIGTPGYIFGGPAAVGADVDAGLQAAVG